MAKRVKRTQQIKRSYTDLSDFWNLHEGKKCFIVGCGPSIAYTDLSKIHSHIVISTNSSILLMPWQDRVDKSDKRRRFWISNDSLCLKWSYFGSHVRRACCTKLIRDTWRRYEDKFRGLGFRYFTQRPGGDNDTYPPRGLFAESSVPTGIDFALMMGCKKIYLVGVDHRMIQRNSHFWQFWDREDWPYRMDKGKYYHPEQKHQLKVFKKNIPIYKMLNANAAKLGAVIYNCSSYSTISVFDKITLTQALQL